MNRHLILNRPRSRRLLFAGLLAAGVQLALTAMPAQAAIGCKYDAATHKVSVTASANYDAPTIGRSGTLIIVDGLACGAAAVDNTDTIVVTGAAGRQDLTLDLASGPFAPGFTPDATSSEIELSIDLGAGSDSLTVYGGPNGERFTAGAAGVNLNNDSDVDIATKGIEELTIQGNGGQDVISVAGGLGTGTTYVGPVELSGGLGKDSLTGGPSYDYLYGGDDNDTLKGGPANDDVYGGSGADTVYGGPGNDYGYPGPGNDVVYGDDGNDTWYADSTVDGSDVFTGGAGRDTVTYFYRTAGSVNVTLDGVANDGASGEADNLKLDIENVTGGAGNDTIVGSTANNSLDGAGGNDTVKGLDGDDTVSGGSTYSDVNGTDKLDGGNGNDSLYGYNGPDTLTGGPGDDSGGGGAGNDTVTMGDGNDNVSTDYTLDGTDVLSGGDGWDYISYYGRTADLTLSLDGVANDGETGEKDNVKADFEDVDGGGGDDTITGNAATNDLYGEGGNDTLNGLAGQDYLYGDDGNDTLIGGDGEDNLYGYAGNDTFQAKDGGYDWIDGGLDTDTLTSANRDADDQFANVENTN